MDLAVLALGTDASPTLLAACSRRIAKGELSSSVDRRSLHMLIAFPGIPPGHSGAFLAREGSPEGAGGKPTWGCVAAGGTVIVGLAVG